MLQYVGAFAATVATLTSAQHCFTGCKCYSFTSQQAFSFQLVSTLRLLSTEQEVQQLRHIALETQEETY